MEQFRNPNGTFNGVKAMAAMTGLSEAEIAWTADRIKHLMHVQKKPKAEALAIVREEGKDKPWEVKS